MTPTNEEAKDLIKQAMHLLARSMRADYLKDGSVPRQMTRRPIRKEEPDYLVDEKRERREDLPDLSNKDSDEIF